MMQERLCTTSFAASAFGLAPNKPGVLNCASGFAQRTSLAGGLNKLGIGNSGGAGGFLTHALAGNAVSGFVNLFRGQGSMADVALAERVRARPALRHHSAMEFPVSYRTLLL